MDNFNIIEPSAFIFFLLIISVGYLIVEIIAWDDYIFRDAINRYSWSNIIDRIIHYICIGILFHFCLLILLAFLWETLVISNILKSGWEFAKSIQFIDETSHITNLISIQLITSSVLYFMLIISSLITITLSKWFIKVCKLKINKPWNIKIPLKTASSNRKQLKKPLKTVKNKI